MKAVDFLKLQREHMERLFGELETANEAEKVAIRARISCAVEIQGAVEEELFCFLGRQALQGEPLRREIVGQRGFIEGCVARRRAVMPRRAIASFDRNAGLLLAGAMRRAAEEEREVLKKALAQLSVQIEKRFNDCTHIDPRKLLRQTGNLPVTMLVECR